MIPQKLVLKNFLSHTHTVLPLEGLHTACICGENGAGKSSLLDAITWVLWGKSRAEAEDDLIYQGQKEMQVDFTFLNRGNCYRVLRTRVRGQASQLEVQILSNGKFRSLTERGLRATQQMLNQQLQMDYETFIYCSYLRQGKADELMLKRPPERKQLLAEILQLDQYEVLADRAKDIARQTKGELTVINQQIDRLQQQLQTQSQVAAKLAALQQDRQRLREIIREQEAQKQEWEAQQRYRSELLQKIEWLQGQIQQGKEEKQGLEQQRQAQHRQWEQLGNVIKKRELIEENYNKYQQISQQLTVMTHKQSQYQQIIDRRQQLREQLQQIETEIRLEIRQYHTQREELYRQRQQLQKILQRQLEIESTYQQYQAQKVQLQEYDRRQAQVTPLQQRLQNLERQRQQIQANLQAKQEALLQQKDQLQKQLAQQQPLQQQLQVLEQQISELHKKQVYQQRVHEKGLERRDFLERLKVRLQELEEKIKQTTINLQQIKAPQANCPLCDQPLNLHHRQYVQQKHEKLLQELQMEVWLIKEQQATSETEIKVLREEYIRLRQELQPYSSLLEQKGRLQSQLEKMTEITHHLALLTQQIQTIETQLNQHNLAPEIETEIQLLKESIRQIGYDERDHALIRNEVERLRWSEIKLAELKQAQQQLQQITNALPSIEAQMQKLTNRLQQQQIAPHLQAQIQQCDQELQTLAYSPTLHQQISHTQAEYKPYLLQYQELQLALQQLPQVQQQYHYTCQLLQQKQTQIANWQQEKEQYQALLENCPDYAPAIHRISQEIAAHKEELEKYTIEIGKLEQLCHQMHSYREQLQELQRQKQQLEHKQRVYQELANCFGKNGIPTLVIETIIPQIEAEANHILGQLTNYQLSLRFITQKSSKKSDKLIETL
ncbi:MAG: AAA family ATPase, partial [Pseudanabaenaceae cyanobacterium]